MLKSIVGVAGLALLLGVAGVRPAHALADDQLIKAHVPFAFEVMGQWMPAGDYVVKSMGINEPGVVEIQSTARSGVAGLFLTLPKSADKKVESPVMVFDEVGKQKFLRSVVIPGEDGIQLPADADEVQAARTVAAASSHTTSRPVSGS
jgi:hypothetical protein